MVVSPDMASSMPNDAAVRRLLRNHPKLHPRSAAAAELKALGLSKLPILEWELEQPWGHFVEISPETGAKPRMEVHQPHQPFQMPSGHQVPPIFGFPPGVQQEAHRPVPARSQMPEVVGPGPETIRLAELDVEEKAVLQEVLSLDRGRDNVPVPQPPRDAPAPGGRRRQLRPAGHEEEPGDTPPAPILPKVAPPKHGRAPPPRPQRVR